MKRDRLDNSRAFLEGNMNAAFRSQLTCSMGQLSSILVLQLFKVAPLSYSLWNSRNSLWAGGPLFVLWYWDSNRTLAPWWEATPTHAGNDAGKIPRCSSHGPCVPALPADICRGPWAACAPPSLQPLCSHPSLHHTARPVPPAGEDACMVV